MTLLHRSYLDRFLMDGSLSVKDLVTDMARDVLGPEMKRRGFRRRGRIFWRDGPDVCQIVSLGMNRFGTSSISSFNVNLSVFWHKVEKLLGNESVGKMPAPEYRCTFRMELGDVVRPRIVQWDATLETDYVKLGKEVLEALLEHGIPWLEYRSDLRRASESGRYLKFDGNPHSSAETLLPRAFIVLCVMQGEKEKAFAEIKRIVKNGFLDVLELAKQLGVSKSELATLRNS